MKFWQRRFFAFVPGIEMAILLGTFVLSSFAFAQGKINIVVSVDWEGRNLQSANLTAMKKFRQEFPQIKMQHFINPAYYTENIEPIDKPDLITKKIKSVLLPGDEQGLHIHGWKNLFVNGGASYRSSPNFVNNGDDEEGVTVPLWAYSEEELTGVFKYGIDILTKNGFEYPHSFRTGGWQATNEVIAALAANNIQIDSSSVPIQHLENSWGNENLGMWVKVLWPQFSIYSQPYIIGLPGKQVIELPNNGCLSDYVTGDEMLADFIKLAKQLKKNPTKDIYYSIGFHQETASYYLTRLKKAVQLITKYSEDNNVAINFAEFPLSNLLNSANKLPQMVGINAADLQ